MATAAPSKLTVEIVGPDQALYPGIVKEINQEAGTILLKFEEDWRPEDWFPIVGANLFESPPHGSVEETRERLVIPGLVQVLYRVKQGAPEGWYPGHVVAESKGLYAVDLHIIPARRVNLPIEQLRLPRLAVPLTADSIHRVQIPVPENAVKEATDERHLAMFAEHGRFDYVRYDPASKSLVVMVYGNGGVRRASILADMHLTHATFRQSMRDEIANMRLELFGPDNSDQSGNYRSEFVVPLHHLSRALGPQQSNLVKARALPGIIRVWLDTKTGRFNVIAIDEHAARAAHELLEVVFDVVYIDQPYVGQIIGKGGANVNEVWRNSQVFGLSIYDTVELLRASGAPFEWREGFVPLVMNGLRADTETAKMLIEYQVDHNRQMDAERGRRPGQDHHGQRQRGVLSRQNTDEREGGEAPVHGAAAAGRHSEYPSNDGRQGRDSQGQISRSELPTTDGNVTADSHGAANHQQYNRGGGRRQPRRDDAQGHYDNRNGQQPRREGPREDKRNGHAETAATVLPPSKEWPGLGEDADGRRSSAGTEGQDIRKPQTQPAAPGAANVQNGEINGHPEGRGQAQPGAGGGGGRGGGNGSSSSRNRNRGGRAAYQRPEDHGEGRHDGVKLSEVQQNGVPNGQQDGGRADVDGEGFQSVPARGKRGRQSRGGGNGVANGIRPAPEEPAENRREDQVSR